MVSVILCMRFGLSNVTRDYIRLTYTGIHQLYMAQNYFQDSHDLRNVCKIYLYLSAFNGTLHCKLKFVKFSVRIEHCKKEKKNLIILGKN